MKKNKGGRPSLPVTDRIEKINFDLNKIKKIASYGLTDAQIADLLDVNESTITRWKKDKQFLHS